MWSLVTFWHFPQENENSTRANRKIVLIRDLPNIGQNSWLQIQRSEFDSRRYQIFWDVLGLERGPLSLVSTTGEPPERKNSGSGLENREYGRRDPSCWPRGTLYQQKLALTSSSFGGPSVGIVRSRTQATECYLSTVKQMKWEVRVIQMKDRKKWLKNFRQELIEIEKLFRRKRCRWNVSQRNKDEKDWSGVIWNRIVTSGPLLWR
jgi:hypothetical protein